jgi:hypothetical protein
MSLNGGHGMRAFTPLVYVRLDTLVTKKRRMFQIPHLSHRPLAYGNCGSAALGLIQEKHMSQRNRDSVTRRLMTILLALGSEGEFMSISRRDIIKIAAASMLSNDFESKASYSVMGASSGVVMVSPGEKSLPSSCIIRDSLL